MTRSKHNLILRAIFALILCCCTASLFAQSTSSSSEDCVGEDSSPAARTRIDWPDFKSFDTGYESSVAIHPSGLIIEVHSSGSSVITYTGLYYRIGKLDPETGTVTWGPSRRWVGPGTNGSWPAVAITKEGYAILTYSNAFTKKNATLRYSVGTLDLEGTTDQLISFKVQNTQFDTGFHDSVSVNYNGTIAEVHEADGGKGIFYRLGHLNAPGSDDFTIVWDTGTNGQKYDNGVNPHISINDNNDVVEVHQVASDDHLLHYARGKASAKQIVFATDHPRYSDNGRRPTVVLLNNGYVIELHDANYDKRNGRWEFFNRVGTLDKNGSTLINWSSNTRLGYIDTTGGIGTDGTHLIATVGSGIYLYYSAAIAP
jgi:hypothetical protein